MLPSESGEVSALSRIDPLTLTQSGKGSVSTCSPTERLTSIRRSQACARTTAASIGMRTVLPSAMQGTLSCSRILSLVTKRAVAVQPSTNTGRSWSRSSSSMKRVFLSSIWMVAIKSTASIRLMLYTNCIAFVCKHISPFAEEKVLLLYLKKRRKLHTVIQLMIKLHIIYVSHRP